MDIKGIITAEATEDQPVTITIHDKLGQPYTSKDGAECTVDVVGSDSERVRKAEAAESRKRLQSTSGVITPEMDWEFRVERAVAAVVAWNGWEVGDETAELKAANVRMLVEVPHILRQIEAGIRDHSSFFVASSNGSSPTRSTSAD